MNAEKAVAVFAVSGLAVLCCAGPALVATILAGSLSTAALAGGGAAAAFVVAFVGLVALWVQRHNRSDKSSRGGCCAVEGNKGKGQP